MTQLLILSQPQKAKLSDAISRALSFLKMKEPLTAVEWADRYFYLSAESSYIKGKWTTRPYQVAILNAMGHPDIEEVNWEKSARVGYTKLIVAAIGYFIEHKSRNIALWQPDDGARDSFSKKHIDSMIRDVKPVRTIFPWFNAKHKNNTIASKVFETQNQIYLLGGKAAKNYREISVDVGIYDELSKFDNDVEKEGSPLSLGDKRLEGSVFRKSIRGSTPSEHLSDEVPCLIHEAASKAAHYMHRYVPCPHCQAFQVLKFGGRGKEAGLIFDSEGTVEKQAASARYRCSDCKTGFYYKDYIAADEKGFWASEEGLKTYDGIIFFDDNGEVVSAPRSISFHCWSAYSHDSPWSQIVRDWIRYHGTREGLKSFINTTLGEVWVEDQGGLNPDDLYRRRENYVAQVPFDECVITQAVDTQDDRFEIETVAWIEGEERYSIKYEIIYGDLTQPAIWKLLYKKLTEQFKTVNGSIIEPSIRFIDSGGSYTDQVYAFSKHYGPREFVSIKGASVKGRPIVTFPKKRNEHGVYLAMIGTDTAKDTLYSRLISTLESDSPHAPGMFHWPISDAYNKQHFEQLTNEKRKLKYVKGRPEIVWDAEKRRNEPWDLAVYNLAAIRFLQQRRGIDLAQYKNTQRIEINEALDGD
jgi:phage terminase large subunit GpA-like protein